MWYFVYYNDKLNCFCSVRYDSYSKAYRAREQLLYEYCNAHFEETAKGLAERLSIDITDEKTASELWQNLYSQYKKQCSILSEEEYNKDSNIKKIRVPKQFFNVK